jgi:hypothetical protein
MSRRVWRGSYLNMGRVRVPPLPQTIAFFDRGGVEFAAGTKWHLIHDETGTWVGITTDPPPKASPATTDYDSGSRSGPRPPTEPRARLIVEDGRLGYDPEELRQGVTDKDQQRILTRVRFDRRTFEIVAPEGWRPGDTLGYEEVEL